MTKEEKRRFISDMDDESVAINIENFTNFVEKNKWAYNEIETLELLHEKRNGFGMGMFEIMDSLKSQYEQK